MSRKHHKRFWLVIFLVAGLSLALAFILFALSKNINLFFTPTQLLAEPVTDKTVRIGGMVKRDSYKMDAELNNQFTITDFQHEIKVSYRGILPDLFKEGQGVVVLGKLDASGQFRATQVLAKHDENYMPPEIRSLQQHADAGSPS